MSLLFALSKIGLLTATKYAANRWMPGDLASSAPEVADACLDHFRAKFGSERGHTLSSALQKCPLPYEFGLLAVALEVSPSAAGAVDNEVGTSIAQALEDFLREPNASDLQKLPSPDTLFLDPTEATQAIATFMSRLADSRGLTGHANTPAVCKAAASETVKYVHADTPPAIRALLQATGRLSRAFTEEARSNVDLSNLVAQANHIVAQLDTFCSSLPDLSVEIYFTVDGSELRLNKGQRPATLPLSWTRAAGEAASAFDHPFRGTTVSLGATYLDPSVLLHHPNADPQLMSLSASLTHWLHFSANVPFALLGDPGCGKTTSCRWIVRDMLRRFNSAGDQSQAYFPLYVSLKSLRRDARAWFSAKLSDRGHALVESCIARSTEMTPAGYNGPPKNCRLLIILDGFDEFAQSNDEYLQAFFDGVDLTARRSDIAVMLTGRTLAFEPHWAQLDRRTIRESTWQRARLQAFHRGLGKSCDAYVRRWLLASPEAYDVTQTESLLVLARDGGSFGDLVETPVLLSMLCRLVSSMRFDPTLSSHQESPTRALSYLIDEAIKWRANPNSADPIPDTEYVRRKNRYMVWAWEATLAGGTDFALDMPLSQDVAYEAALVEFFFQPDDSPGRAAFVHRTVAEYLAASYLVGILGESDFQTASRRILAACRQLVKQNLIFEANFKRLLAETTSKLSQDKLDLMAAVARQLLDALHNNIGSLPWPDDAPTSAMLGAAAEIALLLLLASCHGDVDESPIEQAVTLRRFSPRASVPWQYFTSPTRLNNCSFAHASLVAFNFRNSSVEKCSFANADLTSSNMNSATITQCDFSSANLSRADLSQARIDDCNLSHVDMFQANLSNAWLRKTSLSAQQLGACTAISNLRLPLDPLLAATATAGLAAPVMWTSWDENLTYKWDGSRFIIMKRFQPLNEPLIIVYTFGSQRIEVRRVVRGSDRLTDGKIVLSVNLAVNGELRLDTVDWKELATKDSSVKDSPTPSSAERDGNTEKTIIDSVRLTLAEMFSSSQLSWDGGATDGTRSISLIGVDVRPS
jgi:hypothetical protein